MHMISVFPDASAGLAIAALAAAATVLTSAIARIVLYALAAFAARKALEDPVDGQANANAIRAHRLAVLQAILATLSVHGHAGVTMDGTDLLKAAALDHDPASCLVSRQLSSGEGLTWYLTTLLRR
jgi:predicted anti-sigma-YlaC factor YlaD